MFADNDSDTFSGFGRFNKQKKASFTINTLNLPTSWEYIYQNRKILLKVDQFGPVYAQANPPNDIILFKRENFQKFSSWLTWIKSDEFSGRPFCNFFRPNLGGISPDFEPEDINITYSPEAVLYSFKHEGMLVETEIMVASDSPTIIMDVRITNKRENEVRLSLLPSLLPYINPAMLAPWDKPEWYLKSGFGCDEKFVFWTQLLNMDTDKEKRRTVAFWCEAEDLTSVEISYEKFVGQGSFFCPKALFNDRLGRSPLNGGKWGEYLENNTLYGYPPIYALHYDFMLAPDQSRSFKQVFGMLESEPDFSFPKVPSTKKMTCFMDNETCKTEKNKISASFDKLLSIRSIETPDASLNYYVNEWLPLQMSWVASLDRGWPSGMRGSRDSANDFTAMIPLDSVWSREIIETLMSCQRSDGWYPRQYSALGRKGKHDLRKHVDAGTLVLELLHDYLCYTKDFDFLNKKLAWMDSETQSTVFKHACKTIDYYIKEDNIGEHGLCKIREGDWLDSVNRAGLLGRGESVTVTNQVIIALVYMERITRKYKQINGSIALDQTDSFIKTYERKKKEFKLNLRKYAFNNSGYFSSVFNDDGKWLYSDCDPDGEKRAYGPANWYSIISGAAVPDLTESVLSIMDQLISDVGYRLYWPPMGDIPIEKVGRAGSGDSPKGLWENGNVYNHGSHGFLGRALAVAGKGDLLYEVLKYMLPYSQEKHPTIQAMTPPYAVVNCWQQVPGFMHRGGMSFLTGSIAMGLRMVYEWMLGIKPMFSGLAIDPCIPAIFDNIRVTFKYLDKLIEMEISNNNNKQVLPSEVLLNGRKIDKREKDPFSGRAVFIINDVLFNDSYNKIFVNM